MEHAANMVQEQEQQQQQQPGRHSNEGSHWDLESWAELLSCPSVA